MGNPPDIPTRKPKDKPRTIAVLTSHRLSAVQICDRLAILPTVEFKVIRRVSVVVLGTQVWMISAATYTLPDAPMVDAEFQAPMISLPQNRWHVPMPDLDEQGTQSMVNAISSTTSNI